MLKYFNLSLSDVYKRNALLKLLKKIQRLLYIEIYLLRHVKELKKSKEKFVGRQLKYFILNLI